jgi:hypothetical protein
MLYGIVREEVAKMSKKIKIMRMKNSTILDIREHLYQRHLGESKPASKTSDSPNKKKRA